MERIDELEEWTERVQSPLQHLEHVLQNWVAYFIIPVFAFFNAGVTFSSGMQPDIPLVTSLALSLFLGKTIGVMSFSFLRLKLKLAVLPEGVSFGQLAGISILAGVGFTMSMFIANLAFADVATYGFGKDRNTGRFNDFGINRISRFKVLSQGKQSDTTGVKDFRHKNMDLYFIAIIPHSELREKIRKIKERMKSEYGAGHALKSPAHITLQMPFKRSSEDETLISEALRRFVSR